MPYLPNYPDPEPEYDYLEDLKVLLNYFLSETENTRHTRSIPYHEEELDFYKNPYIKFNVFFTHVYIGFYLMAVIWLFIYDYTIKSYGLPVCLTDGLLGYIYYKFSLCIDGQFNNWPLALIKPILESIDEFIDEKLWKITEIQWHGPVNLTSLDSNTFFNYTY